MKKIILLLLLFTGCESINKKEAINLIDAPVAKKIPKELAIHGDTRIDNYHWMRLTDEQKNAETPDGQTQDVLDYLNAENQYLEKIMEPSSALKDKLYEEIIGRIKKDDQSVPVKDNGYSYYSRFEEGGEYALYCRKKLDEGAKEEIMLNGPEMAKDYSYYGIGSRSVSLDNNLLAFGIDTVSRRQYTIYFKDLNTDELLVDKLENTGGRATWANDNKTIFYTTKDPVTLRTNKIYKHIIGTEQSADKMVYEEKDETYRCFVIKSKSKKYIMSGSFSTESTEYRYINADSPTENWKIIHPREKDMLYYVDHYRDDFFIRTNMDAKNFRLMKTPVAASSKENWVEVIAHRDDVLLEGFDLFKNFLVIEERINGLKAIRIMSWEGEEYYLPFNDPAYVASTTANRDFDTDFLRYSYTSLTTPYSTFEYNMKTKEQVLLKQQEVIDPNFSPENYTSERLLVTARDGVSIPVSLVYNKNSKLTSNTPLLLYGYGSYGYSMEPYFSSSGLSLLDRGFVYAIAHVRGGEEMGRAWYEEGKLLKKKNTFTDFIDVGKFLVEKEYTSPEHLYAMGASAGGLLMGAILNMEPDLWNGVIAIVPWVDVISSMLDDSIPLTTSEFNEWGNPKNKEYYDYMKSYSPYDNVEAKEYPNILITTGYWDSQVQYWEPAKWIAKLRDLKTDDNMLIMDCNMDVGHGGASGRFERQKQTALYYAFLLNLENIEE